MSRLLPSRANLVEEMDDRHCDSATLAKTYAHFETVNRLVSGREILYRRRILPAIRNGAKSILDVGCGGGDVIRYLARRAQADGYAIDFCGIDPDERAIAFAKAHGTAERVRFECDDIYNLSRRYDLLISNHVLHHLDSAEVARFCNATSALCNYAIVHSDLCRSAWALSLFPFVGVWFHGSFILRDGMTSIRRAFSPSELAELAPEGWKVDARLPFRLELTWNASI